MTTLPTSRVTVDGMSLRYADLAPEVVDDGTDTLLVIPGHTARIEGFEELAPLLARRHRVLVVDCPGSGGSDKPDRRYDLRFYEDTLVGFLDALGIDRAVPVGGSLGGNLVLRLGHRFPDRFRRLALWAPGSAWKAKPLVASVAGRLGRRAFWPSVRIQSRYWYDPDYAHRQRDLDATFAYYREVMGPGFVRMYWGLAADQLRHSLFDLAPTIAQPTLLVWGDHDHGGGMGKGCARLAELLPDVRFEVLEGRRHSLEAEAPADLAALILDFLATTSVPAP